jgi:hypothetical protein
MIGSATATLDLPVDGHFENALWFVAEHEAGELDVRV